MFNMKNFKGEIFSTGILPTNKYLVTFAPPKSMGNRYEVRDLASAFVGSNNVQMDRISLRCDSVQLPGMALGTVTGLRYGYGAMEEIPYSAIFDKITLSWIVDKESDIHRFFYKWMNTIVNFHSAGQTGMLSGNNRGTVKNMHTYEVGYMDSYTTDIEVFVYGQDNKKVMSAKAYRAYPTQLPNIDLNWSTNDEFMKLSIPFAYTDFEVTYESNLQPGQPVEAGQLPRGNV